MIIGNFSPDNIVLSARTDIKWIVRGCRLSIADVKRDLLVTHNASYSFTLGLFSALSLNLRHHRELIGLFRMDF